MKRLTQILEREGFCTEQATKIEFDDFEETIKRICKQKIPPAILIDGKTHLIVRSGLTQTTFNKLSMLFSGGYQKYGLNIYSPEDKLVSQRNSVFLNLNDYDQIELRVDHQSVNSLYFSLRSLDTNLAKITVIKEEKAKMFYMPIQTDYCVKDNTRFDS